MAYPQVLPLPLLAPQQTSAKSILERTVDRTRWNSYFTGEDEIDLF
jgi:hypothetical protein